MARRRPNFFEVVGVCAPAIVDPHIAAFVSSQLLQRLAEHGIAGLSFRIVRGERATPHSLCLLRARRERPSSRAAKQRYETASTKLIECHPTPMSRDRTADYGIYEGQSGGIWQGHDGRGLCPAADQ